ncbi:MAG: hypothetical protein H0V62_01710 [Gammaproteobacteria bacterium]|nr:hypothetical protein [Gammaproteobacteria bacterium]
MLFRRKHARDEIPTLHDLVEDEAPTTLNTDTARVPARKHAPSTAEENKVTTATSAQSRSTVETTIEAMIGEILNRHMQNAHKEITRAVLTEVRARLRRDERAKTS